MIEEKRICKTCGLLLPISSFYQRSDRPNETWHVCKKCTCEKHKEYSKTHSEKIKEISARTREKNREKIRQRNREFYEKTKNDPDHIAARKASFERHGKQWRENKKKKRADFNQKWKHPCEKCGESRLYLIQFHHIDPTTKSFCIGAAAEAKKTEELEKEVKKCVCLCSNCHDEFHYFYGQHPERPVEDLEEYLNKRIVVNDG